MKSIRIKTKSGYRQIGSGKRVFIIAEMSCNHNKDIKRAYKIIDAIAEAGADAVKLQTYTADTITIDCDKEYFQVKNNDAWKGQTLYSLYKKAFTPWEWQPKLKEYAEKKGLIFFSTPFDNTAVDFLEKMKVSLYKVASFEVVDIPLLERIGKTKKPVIMSRGMASAEELKLAIKTLKKNGCPQVAILHCVSSYPAKSEEMNLATIPDIKEKFGVIAGLSDHTLGTQISIASISLGADIIEKHITLSRTGGGLDASFSLEPNEFKELVKSIREVESAIGFPTYHVGKKESANIIYRKSLFIVNDIKKGEKFSEKNVRSIRPGYGLEPKYYYDIIGKKSAIGIEKGEPLKWSMIITENNSDYKVEKVRKSDSRRIWKIRNHPAIRQYSLNNATISFKKHQKWFKEKYFNNKNNFCFILKENGYALGYCRYDYDNEKKAYMISIAIDSKKRGKGLGSYLLSVSLKKINYKKKNTILAEVKKSNISSIKLFERNGFEKYMESEGEYLFRRLVKK